MPVEIRELIIKAFIEPENQKDVRGTNANNKEEHNQPISETVGQLLELINNKNER